MLTLSRNAGIGGSIKYEPDAFIVKEITGSGFTLEPGKQYTAESLKEAENPEGKFTTFVLEKKNWETIRAILTIAKHVGRGRKSISYAGTKDKFSVSVQLASIYGAEPEKIKQVKLKDISINGSWKSDGLELGSNLGNAFAIVIKGINADPDIRKTVAELDGRFPNYFDKQRFGIRLNNPKIGISILKNRPEDAVMTFLTDTSNETNQEAVEARERLEMEEDFNKALYYFPRHLKYERTMIEYLSRYRNFANAIRKLPRGIALMFVHSVEAVIFNAALEERIRKKDFEANVYCMPNFYGFPDTAALQPKGTFPLGTLVGYETEDGLIGEYEKGVMSDMGLSKEDFRIKSIPELSAKGDLRPILSPFKDFSSSVDEGNAAVNFSIPAGSYATVLANEITKLDVARFGELWR